METKQDSWISDAPNFKLARVGEDRKKRRGGAFYFLRSAGPRGVWSGATGGSGAAVNAAVNAVGMAFSKSMMSILVTAGIGSAAMYMGGRSAPGASSEAPTKPAIFSEKREIVIEGDTSNLPSTSNSIPNSLGYISGRSDGLTPDERARKEAEAAAAGEAQSRADEAAAKKSAADDAAAGDAAAKPDVGALLASAQVDGKGNAFSAKFGALSSSLGAGSSLSGGAGMSGGMNRQFGASGSLGKGLGGQLSASPRQARPTSSKVGRAVAKKSNIKGVARRQLENVVIFSQKAIKTSGDTVKYTATSSFEDNTAGGEVITGLGISKGVKTLSGAPDTVGLSGPLGSDDTKSCSGGSGGRDFGSQSDAVLYGASHPGEKVYYMDSKGACQEVQTPPTRAAKTKYDWIYTAAQTLLGGIVIMSALAAAFMTNPWTMAGALALRMGIMIAGGMIAALGAAMIALTGDKIAGGILFATGAFIGLSAYVSVITTDVMVNAWPVLIGSVLGMLGASMAHKPTAALE